MGPETRPLVSVITPFLDAERFLREAVDSVFAQTYDRWELLLVDDGSSDASTDIARAYAGTRADRVRYLEHPRHEHRGLSASRNLGLAEARGEVVAFLDSDDVYLPPKLERQVAMLAANPGAGMIYGRTLHWYSWSGRPEDTRRDTPRHQGLELRRIIEPPHLLARLLLGEVTTPCTCGVLIRREAVERAGRFEESFRGLFEDQVYFYKLCATTAVYADDGCWDRYRQHPRSLARMLQASGTWDGTNNPTAARRPFLLWLGAFIDERQIADPRLREAYRRQMLAYTQPWRYRLSRLVDRAREAGRAARPVRRGGAARPMGRA